MVVVDIQVPVGIPVLDTHLRHLQKARPPLVVKAHLANQSRHRLHHLPHLWYQEATVVVHPIKSAINKKRNVEVIYALSKL